MPAHRLLAHRPPALVLILAAATLATGCSFSVGDESPTPQRSGETVTSSDVTAQAEELIGPKMPEGSTLDCPDPLAAEVDATTRCTWSMPDGSSIGMSVTVTEITDGTARLKFTNDDAATPSPTS